MTELFVQDLRDNNSPSLQVIPRIETYEELLSWVDVSIHSEFGWDVAPNNSLVWKLVGFYIRDGVAEFIPKFQLENGSPAEGIAVVHSWNGAPALPNPDSITPDYNNKTGVVGFSNANGDAGFPYSGGMVYIGNKPYIGAGIIWPLCPQHLSEPKYADAVFGLGWMGGTDHTTINPIFRLVRKQSQPSTGKFSLCLFQDGIDLGLRLTFVEQSTGSGYELVLIDESGQIIGSTKFA
jgi:hypothetical protein